MELFFCQKKTFIAFIDTFDEFLLHKLLGFCAYNSFAMLENVKFDHTTNKFVTQIDY